jgi:hypothetical protein
MHFIPQVNTAHHLCPPHSTVAIPMGIFASIVNNCFLYADSPLPKRLLKTIIYKIANKYGYNDNVTFLESSIDLMSYLRLYRKK